MEVRDGFIVGVYNYCDSWCRRCALTSYCRVFADCAEIDASLDPGLKAVVDAPPLPQDAPPPPPQWLCDMLDELDRQAAQPVSPKDREETAPRVRDEHVAIEHRASAYRQQVYGWLESSNVARRRDRSPEMDVVVWFHTSIAAKIHRALTGLAESDQMEKDPIDREAPADEDGSAKVALLGIDESHAAFLALVETGAVCHNDAAGFIADLVWLGEALERAFPNARAFVRPGLDEPVEVARLRAADGG